MPVNEPSSAARPNPLRSFGRFELRRLLGKSAGTMVWLAFDPRRSHEVMLALPRLQPAGAAALEHWTFQTAQAARLNHPNLAPVLESGVQDSWPFVAVDRQLGVTLAEWLEAHPNPAPADVAGWICDCLQGLAFAHEAGATHLDPQLYNLLISERGAVSLVALEVAGDSPARAPAFDPNLLRTRRALAERDVLACGLLLHHLLTGKPALDQADPAAVIARMAPGGREPVRLAWTTPLPIPEALRAIANRCTAVQERLRYRGARTLLGALGGWRAANARDDGGPVALLVDRLRTVGHLPALPGLAARVARLTGTDGRRTDEIAEQVMHDMALSFELLRTLNSAQVQGTQIPGNGSVLTLQRAIALIGVNGVQMAANSLRAWPGPLGEAGAAALQSAMNRARLAGHAAQALRPAGYDAQVVYLIAVLQNLGRLMLRYHFADEAEQIWQLMQPAPAASAEAGPVEQPGMSEQAAAFAVLGVDLEALGLAVARQWGLGEDVLHMIRRLPESAPVRKPDDDSDMLRLTASAANETVDAASVVPIQRAGAALAQVAQRYARVLALTPQGLHEVLQAARDVLTRGIPAAAPARPAAGAEGAADAAPIADERAV